MKRRLQRVVMIATALLFTTAAYSQNQFKNVYGTGGNEFPVEYLTNAQGTYFCGRTEGRPSLTLVDDCGKILFNRIYNYTNFTAFTSMTFAPNGDILMHATTANEDWFVLRVDPAGNPIWGNNYHNNRERRAYIVPSANDTYFIVGWWSPGGSGDDVAILRIDGAGGQIWAQRLNDVDDQVMDVISDQNGGLIACGGLHSVVDMFTIQVDQNGIVGPAMEYQQTANHRFEARAVTQAQNGDFLFLGVSSTTAAWTPTILTVLRTDAGFNPIWQSDFNAGVALNPISMSIQEGVNGNIYFTTQANWGGLMDYSITELDPFGGVVQTRSIPDMLTAQLNLNGAEQYHLNDRILLMGNTQTINPFGMDDEILEMVDLNLNLCDGPQIDPISTNVSLINIPWNPVQTQMLFQITPQLSQVAQKLEFKQICECFPFPPAMEPSNEIQGTKQFTIYPNITNGEDIHLAYEMEEGESAHLEVIDMSTGRQIEHLSIDLDESGEMTINFGDSKLEHGVYQFSVIYNNSVVSRRLIVL